MKTLRMTAGLVCCCIISNILLRAETAPSTEFTVSGAVVSDGGGEPLARMRVSLITAQPGSQLQRETVTGEDGRFRFSVPEGRYSLTASRNGIPRQIYGGLAGFGSAVITGPGKPSVNLHFRMYLPAVIKGTIKDDFGDPVENASVEVYVPRILAGRKQTITAATATTNDLGEYSVGNLRPGQYFLAATGSPWYNSYLAPIDQSGEQGRQALAAAYYPHASDAGGAPPITLGSGQQARADLTLTTVPGSLVTVRTADPQILSNVANTFTLTANSVEGMRHSQYAGSMFASPQISVAVPPGHYQLEFRATRNGAPIFDSQPLDAGDSQVEVQLHPKELPRVTGELVFQEPSQAAGFHGFLALLESSRPERGVALIKGTKLSFSPVLPGSYRLLLGGEPGYYIKSVSVDGRMQPDQRIELTAAHAPRLTVTVETGVGRFTGIVKKSGTPLPAALVVLVPVLQSAADRLSAEGFQTESDGSFDFPNVPPGQYRLMTSCNLDLEYTDPEVMRPLLKTARMLTVKPGQIIEQDLDILLPPPAGVLPLRIPERRSGDELT